MVFSFLSLLRSLADANADGEWNNKEGSKNEEVSSIPLVLAL